MKDDVKARAKHEASYRCAYCHADVDAAEQAPCSGCGSMMHPACRVQHGGCPTLGCAQQAPLGGGTRGEPHGRSESLERPAPARPAAAARPEPTIVLAWLSLGSGALGMVLSFLALLVGVLPGAAGFLAGSLLIGGGLVALTIAGRRRRSTSAVTGAPLGSSAAVLSRVALAAGLLGMAVSFLFFGSSATLDLLAGAAGFLSGAVLSAAGLVSMALSDEEPAP